MPLITNQATNPYIESIPEGQVVNSFHLVKISSGLAFTLDLISILHCKQIFSLHSKTQAARVQNTQMYDCETCRDTGRVKGHSCPTCGGEKRLVTATTGSGRLLHVVARVLMA